MSKVHNCNETRFFHIPVSDVNNQQFLFNCSKMIYILTDFRNATPTSLDIFQKEVGSKFPLL